MMSNSLSENRAGGLAALFCALSYIFGFGLFLGVLDRSGYDGLSGDLAFALDNQAAMVMAMIILYLAFGVALAVLVIALHRRMASDNDFTLQIATSFGLVWVGLVLASGMTGLVGLQSVARMALEEPQAAATIWSSIGIVQSALGGGIELVGGLWMLLICVAAIRDKLLPAWLNWPGILIAIAGICTFIPGMGDLAAIFGLGQILWFTGLGVHMLRRPAMVLTT
ncbi:DUF4386 family protein [Alterisphingorhabdus coralli]|uniref:DUF4386 family protein n=1 Tax=Alterisphingorhabdus coralli TaxID=3071408 RepID=A0AA97F847_9SPHN|nr:DUF4386 family protein [Parasphingorhabdus sp. SCSIO 66989]WOE75926.1 DUF4386 family protein [Parasphingorhabdus sp. SCSIO 66989]